MESIDDDISSRLVVGQASMKMKHKQIQPILDKLAAAVDAREAEASA
jgi:ATP phosphoribosyltransferase